MKILITGSNGLVGQKLIENLMPREDIEIIATSKGDNRFTESEDYVYESLDITVKDEVNKMLTWYKPDVVINTAAMTNVDACELDHAACKALNVTAVEHMLNALTHVKKTKTNYDPLFIHLSTDFIFDGEAGPYTEADKAVPLSYYGHSKLRAEELVNASSLRTAIVRTILVYGVGVNLSRSNIVLWIKESLESKKDINIVDDQFRTPTLSDDLAIACIKIAIQGKTGIYNISGKDFMSIYELAERVADFFGLDKKYIHASKSKAIKQPAMRPPKTGFILDKAIAEIGYNPRSFEEGLAIVKKDLEKAVVNSN